jgi:four helix bundle protein
MKENLLEDKSYNFALRIVKLCRYLADEQKEFVLSRKILDSGTAVGSHVEEAGQAESSENFLHHLATANKKAFETNFWLRLLRDSQIITDKQAESILADCVEMQKLLTSATKTTKRK